MTADEAAPTHDEKGSAMRELTEYEHSSLTVWGETISAQMRDGSLVLHAKDNAVYSSEDGHPLLIPPGDTELLHALLDAARERALADA